METTGVTRSGGRAVSMIPDRQAFFLLRTVFTVAPIIFGLDKFTNILADWTIYLAPVATSVVPVPAHTFMYVVGVVEIIAGIAVALRPRFGSLLVAVWLRHHRQPAGPGQLLRCCAKGLRADGGRPGAEPAFTRGVRPAGPLACGRNQHEAFNHVGLRRREGSDVRTGN